MPRAVKPFSGLRNKIDDLLRTMLASLLLLAGSASADSFYHIQRDNSALKSPAATADIRAAEDQVYHYVHYTNPDSVLANTITQVMATYYVPGAAACAVKDGIMIWKDAFGYANIEEDIRVSDTTLFMLASISKTLTGAALLQLWETGLFELDDNINDYLPFDIVNPKFPADVITFRMILSHASSLKDNWDVMYSTYVQGDTPIPLSNYVQAYFLPGGYYYDQYENFNIWAPGTRWQYCNHNFVVAGYLVEALTGIAFDQYCHDSIFAPLGMDETAWFLRDLDTGNIAMPYHTSGGNYQPCGQFGYADYPAGTLRTGTPQLARFLLAIMHKGTFDGITILDSTTVDSITTIQYPALSSNMGLVWFYQYVYGRYVWRHGGADQGVNTIMAFSPGENTGVIVLTNGESFTATDRIAYEIFEYAETYIYSDADDDDIPDNIDNCPGASNPEQTDTDQDEAGDMCDLCAGYDDRIDTDGEGVPDGCDICPGSDDFIDGDSDNVPDGCDVCPGFDDNIDSDGDGIPDDCDFICGDANGDDAVNVGDAVYLINHIFHDGPAPDPVGAGDVNCDSSSNVGDAVYLINYIFINGAPIPCAICQ